MSETPLERRSTGNLHPRRSKENKHMGNVLWHIYMSLDGVIARPGDDMKWIFDLAEPDEFVDEVVRTTGAVIMGRRTYEVEDRDRPGIYGGAWTGPSFVVTHEPPTDVPDWMTGTFVTDGVESALEQAEAAAGDKNVVLLGANLARQCLELDRRRDPRAGHADPAR